jgi:hypothetical protein
MVMCNLYCRKPTIRQLEDGGRHSFISLLNTKSVQYSKVSCLEWEGGYLWIVASREVTVHSTLCETVSTSIHIL